MINRLLFAVLLAISLGTFHNPASAAAPPFEWVKTSGGVASDGGGGMAVDSEGNVYWAGLIPQTGVVEDQSHQGLFIIKFNRSGQRQWITKLAPSGFFEGREVRLAVSGDSVVVVADSGGGISFPQQALRTFAASFSRNDGSLKWVKPLGYNSNSTPSVVIDTLGNIYVTGDFDGAEIDGQRFVAQGRDGFLAKFSPAGTLLWFRKFGGTQGDLARNVAFDGAGNILVVGYFTSPLAVFGPNSVQNAGGYDGFVAKYDSNGNAAWARSFGGSDHETATGIATSADGTVFVVGRYQGTARFGEAITLSTTMRDSWAVDGPTGAGFIATLDSSGRFTTVRSLGDRVSPTYLIPTSDGSLAMGGFFSGSAAPLGQSITSRGDLDVFILKFIPSFNGLWAKAAGFVYEDYVNQLAASPAGELYVAGAFYESAHFDSTFIEGRGSKDGFLAKLSGETTGIPVVATQPQPQAVFIGTQATFSVQVTSTTAARFQWFFNGVAIPGQTSATLTLNNVGLANEGFYYVEASNDFGTVRSASAQLLLRGRAPVQVTTLAGNGTAGYQDATRGADARFSGANSPAVQSDGVLFVPDTFNHTIRIIEPGGAVGTLAGKVTPGFTDGPASAALFNRPLAVALDAGRDLYVADTSNNVIRKISAIGVRQVSTYAGSGARGFKDGALREAQFDFPNDLVVDGAGNLFVIEFNNHTIRKVGVGGQVTTVAGNGAAGYRDGTGTGAQFRFPAGIARDEQGNLFVTEWSNHTIRKVTTAGVVSTIAGSPGKPGFADGPGGSALLNIPDAIAVDGVGNLYFTEQGNHTVRRIGIDGMVTTVAGTGAEGLRDGDGTQALFKKPGGILVTFDGALIVADTGNNAIRRVSWITTDPPPQPVAYISLHPGVTVFGIAGRTYQIEATESPGPTSQWAVLGRVTLATPVQTWYDPVPATRKTRVYRLREVGN